jgi:hypothetical protein
MTAPSQNRRFIFIILAVAVGYFLAMLLRRAGAERTGDKVTFAGLVGTFITAGRFPYLSSFFAGLAVYEAGHRAGFTFVPDTEGKPLGKILKNALGKEESITSEGKTFAVKLSKWFPPYYRDEKGNLKPAFWDILDQPYQENGVYFIRKTESREIVYIGVVIEI